jgi:hypothetical protein
MNEKIQFIGMVKRIEEIKQKEYVHGVGADALFKEVISGWKILVSLRDSVFSIVFYEKPKYNAGDRIRFTMEVENN